jgi:hypothetical protein
MTDEEQLRSLLMIATALPDDLQPPVSQLLKHGRRRRRLRSGTAVAAAAVLVVLAAGIPPVIRSIGTGRPLAITGHGPRSTRPLREPSKPEPSSSRQPSPGPTPAGLSDYRWATLAPSPLGPRQPDIVTWVGRDLLEIGGAVHGKPSKTGAAYDPIAKRWHATAPVPFDVNVAFATFTSTGRQLFVTDGRFPRCGSGAKRPAACEPHAGLYNPVTNRWTTTQLPSPMYGLPSMTSTWTGRDVILAGVTVGNPKLEVASYDPVTGRWTMIAPALPSRHSPGYAAVVATSNRVIMWVSWSYVRLKPHPKLLIGTDVLALGRNGRWQDVTGNWPQRRTAPAPVFTGTEILIPTSENRCVTPSCSVSPIYPGAFADPITLRRTPIPFSPIDALQPPYIAAGPAIIEVQPGVGATLRDGRRIREDETVAFDPASGTWQRLATPPGQPPFAATPVWTGTELLALTEQGELFAFEP